ncbi:DNA repair and recombination protein RadB [Natronorarus salvus]|uniref:DNA repair and recombination protein RadB n=1 Tax=Natronorarus salvus TaxID=3117733 RepID=UPI002F26B5EF
MNDEGRLPTGCGALDELVCGGLERGTVTQVYGPPAAGKTNVALCAAVAAAARGERSVVIDTEGISIDRFGQLLEASAADTEESIETISGRVVLQEVYDFEGQEEAVRDAAELAENVDLIVLDSATGFYRLERDDDDGGETLRRVGRQVTHLLSLARRHDLAVLITNQVFTDPDADRIRALGGHTLGHLTGTVVRLDRFRGGNRRATLEKHRAKAVGENVTFRITGDGMESVEDII